MTTYSDEQLNKLADDYIKLRPFVRRSGGRLIWDPSTDESLAPTFEQYLELRETLPVPGFRQYSAVVSRELRREYPQGARNRAIRRGARP